MSVSESCAANGAIAVPGRPFSTVSICAGFGPLTVFPDGLLMKGRKYAWDDIRSYEIDNGYLRINPYMKKGCQPGEFALSQIPNYQYLLELMEARTGRTLMET